ncbi:tyrosine-protein phosphatase [Wenjunlia tyrosinilytica]|uniref:Protein-tyrosine-phosphatase n=1 Tax=Wenjunlia tyrosinilytica TaxID=1544741 RepID=A0A918E025_9ACTN|nr:tyrosine-protein phosphatase [Wenjunlia tyrosinilytica]GGO95812.1 protein-tyrosine-phosphatase [Wenjunlia tyrosinilytica]
MSQEIFETVPTEPGLEGVRNFRDVGGLPTADGRRVRSGRLFRSGHLAFATEEDARFLRGLGLRFVFDFRNDSDIELEGPDVDLPGVRHVRMPLSDPAHGAEFWKTVRDGDVAALRERLGEGRAGTRMQKSYRRMVRERTAEHSRLLRTLAEEDGLPALMHCAAGKDRAGMSIVVVLLALGVERDAIEADYLRSNEVRNRYRLRRDDGSTHRSNGEALELLRPLFEARVEYLESAYQSIEEHWGSTERYLTEGLDCGPQRRERLRALLLDGEG